MFWNTAERGRLERFGRGLFLPGSADASPPAEIYKCFLTTAEDRDQTIALTLSDRAG